MKSTSWYESLIVWSKKLSCQRLSISAFRSLAIFDIFIQRPHMKNKEKLQAVQLHFIFCMLELRWGKYEVNKEMCKQRIVIISKYS